MQRPRSPPDRPVPRNCVTRIAFLCLACKPPDEAAKTWRRRRAPEKVADLLGGARYNDGTSAPDDPPEEQRQAT
jgi:hypothetical protein